MTKQDKRLQKTKVVSLSPEAATDHGIPSIMDMLDMDMHPPQYPPPEMHMLDFHNDGISVVREALAYKPVKGIAYRELSRMAAHEAVCLMCACKEITELCERQAYLRQLLIDHEQYIRNHYTRIVETSAQSYCPSRVEENVHVWLWSHEDASKLNSLISDAVIPRRIFFVFVAESLSNLCNMGKIATDLRFEYNYGMVSLRFYLTAVNFAIDDLTKNAGDFTLQ